MLRALISTGRTVHANKIVRKACASWPITWWLVDLSSHTVHLLSWDPPGETQESAVQDFEVCPAGEIRSACYLVQAPTRPCLTGRGPGVHKQLSWDPAIVFFKDKRRGSTRVPAMRPGGRKGQGV